ncbi:MAG: DUF3515 domain-containing protein [Phycicoccus sp.]|uniref:DUF3515 family protein n=1 Tax=Phycicoccus sp. TaxID=1902410 RepID=UPI002584A5BB|nr:DUF3515 family protein [Phycicoccus sp.]MCO5303622.1 DUF3515 domain-containing protein [Phycicoccus sp.]HRV58113.1 DUF3515 family protein [Phycicoccus sp.]
MNRVRGTAAALGAAAVLVCALAGCSGGPEVTAAGAGGGDACRSATEAFPSTVSGMPRLDSVTAPGTAAWGDPAVIARCGVPGLAPTDVECVEVDDVGWIPRELSDGTAFTSFGTDPALEVLVPTAYAPEPLLLPAFGAAAKALPPNGLACR